MASCPQGGQGLLTLSTARILAQMKTSRGRSSRAELCSSLSTYGKMPTDRACRERTVSAEEQVAGVAGGAAGEFGRGAGSHRWAARREQLSLTHARGTLQTPGSDLVPRSCQAAPVPGTPWPCLLLATGQNVAGRLAPHDMPPSSHRHTCTREGPPDKDSLGGAICSFWYPGAQFLAGHHLWAGGFLLSAGKSERRWCLSEQGKWAKPGYACPVGFAPPSSQMCGVPVRCPPQDGQGGMQANGRARVPC